MAAVESYSLRALGSFQRMGQPRTKELASTHSKYLGLTLQPSKSGRMYDLCSVFFEDGTTVSCPSDASSKDVKFPGVIFARQFSIFDDRHSNSFSRNLALKPLIIVDVSPDFGLESLDHFARRL